MTKQKVTLKFIEIQAALGALVSIGKRDGLEFKLNYKLAKNSKVLEPIVRTYEETLKKFFEEKGVYPNENGNYNLDKEDKKTVIEFNKTNKDLFSETYEVDVEMIPSEFFSDHDIPAEQLRFILWMIKE